jgi:hypothetical protein
LAKDFCQKNKMRNEKAAVTRQRQPPVGDQPEVGVTGTNVTFAVHLNTDFPSHAAI